MKQVMALILAAGEGTRMKSETHKVLHRVCGRPIVDWVLDAAREVSDTAPVVIVGHRQEQLREHLADGVRYAVQPEQLGTGHAVACAGEYLENYEGYVLVMAGDAPMVQGESLRKLTALAREKKLAAALLTARLENPFGYGRIVRDENGNVQRIVEQKDATPEEAEICEVNISLFCFEAAVLREGLKALRPDNAAGEYYLTDVIGWMIRNGMPVGALTLADAVEGMGINTREQLAACEEQMRRRICRRHMAQGVTMIAPDQTYIGADVEIGPDTVIYPNCHLEGKTVIEKGCTLYPDCRIVDSAVGSGTTVDHSTLLEARVGRESKVGPYAYLRPGAEVGDHVRIGDFVELKKARIGNGSKVSHLTYVGDGKIGENCNIGCGVVFVNYDGHDKNVTEVGDRCFIGCNVNLISPVRVEDDAYIAAGTTVTQDVPAGALCIGRARQSIKEGWVRIRRALWKS